MLALVLAVLPGTALASPVSPSPHPTWQTVDGVRLYGPVTPAANGKTKYLICLRHDPSQCLAINPVLNDLIAGGIDGVISIGAGIIIWLITRDHDGDETAQDDGIDKGKPEKPSEFGECLGANTSGARAFLSRPSRCFGNIQTSFIPVLDGGTATYQLWMRGTPGDILACLNTRNGAFVYHKPASQPGLWVHWAFYEVA